MNMEDYFDTERTKLKVVMVDFNNLAHVKLFGANSSYLQKVSDPNYQMTPTDLYDIWKNYMVQSLFDFVKNFKPDKFIIAVDSKSWRKKFYSEYKGNRDAQREASTVDFETFYPVMNQLVEDLKQILPNAIILKVDESEVDDIIAVLSKTTFKDDDVIIVSTDKDFRQLLQYKNVRIYNPDSRVKAFVTSLNPKEELNFKVMIGDSGDNIGNILKMPSTFDSVGEKSIGVGPAVAEKILSEGLESEYVIERVLNKYPNISNEAIIKHVKENYQRNLKLISFEHIPLEIQKRIQEEYSKYQIKKFSQMSCFTWLIENKIRLVADNLQTYSMFLKELH